MKAEGSYQFETLEGRQQEAKLLAERAQMRLEGFVELLVRHGFPKKGRALEVGAAQGIRTRLMASHFPEVEVLGVDRAPELLAQARLNTLNLPNLSYEVGDLYDLPYAENSFDFIYCRLVFMHLTDPLRALSRLKALLRPGGRILIEDADRDCMFFEPAPSSFKKFWSLVQEGQRRLGGDPNVGRKLAPYLKESGFRAVQVEMQPILGNGDDIQFLARTLLPSLNVYLESRDRDFGKGAIADLLGLSLDSRATFYHFWFVASGEKS